MGYLDKVYTEADAARAIEIADRIWWVGHYLPGDPFQCHVYLIEHGDQSVLLDPGSHLTFAETRRKIDSIIDFDQIKYFVCHHQDPDITLAMQEIDKITNREDAVLVCHWRAAALLKHYALKMPFWLVDENDWKLDLGGRVLDFVFTPYAHFPGAFCTYDQTSGTLFSSDIFGGFTEGFQLVAAGEEYFESLRPFHEHYIPSRDIMGYTLDRLSRYDLKLIAPQHGSIIRQNLIPFIMHRLRDLDCGLYLMTETNTDILRLSELNQVLRDITETMILYRDFQDIANSLLTIARRLLPLKTLDFYALNAVDDMLHFSMLSNFRGSVVKNPVGLHVSDLQRSPSDWDKLCPHGFMVGGSGDEPVLIMPLYHPDQTEVVGVVEMGLKHSVNITEHGEEMLEKMRSPFLVALEREIILRNMDLERQRFYDRSIRDALTGLYTRFYMNETTVRLFGHHDRHAEAAIGLILMDIDKFKMINDTHGHATGDLVLRGLASKLTTFIRQEDFAVRLGGEEFALFVVGIQEDDLAVLSERIRAQIEESRLLANMPDFQVTVSIGTAVRHQAEPLNAFIERADVALYKAKNTGRNRVVAS